MEPHRKRPGIGTSGTSLAPGLCHAEAAQRSTHATTTAPACGVWAGPQPSGMPDANRLNATAADHRDGHTKGPFRGIRATLKPVPPMVPGKCRTRMPRHGALGAESRTTSRTPYIGRFCGRPDYLMPAAPFRPKEIVHGPRHSPACATPPPKHRRHILQAPGQPPDQAPAPSSPAA